MSSPTDYRIWLKNILTSRIQQNPRYSLRAFARDLNFSPSRLSQILQGKEGISASVSKQFAQSLEFSDEEQKYFVLLVEAQDSRSRETRKRALAELAKVRAPAMQNVDESTLLLNINPRHLEEFKSLIWNFTEKFKQEAVKQSLKTEDPAHVYALSVQLVRLGDEDESS